MRSIAIVSGKGGVGKTTSAINLGVSLSSLGKNVIIVDANVSTPDIGLSLGAPVVPIALQLILSGEEKAERAIYRDHSGTKIMPSSLSFVGNVKMENLKAVIEELKKISDIVLIDCAAGMNRDALTAIAAADECLIVTNPEMPALASAMKTINAAKVLNKKVAGVLVTKSNRSNDIDLKNIKSLLEKEIIGVVPEDKNVRNALLKRDALVLTHPKSRASRSYMQVAQYLSGNYEASRFERLANLLEDFKDLIFD